MVSRHGGGSQVTGRLKGPSVQLVDPDAVSVVINYIQQPCLQQKPILGLANNLEHGLLNSMSATFAYLGDLPQPSLTIRRSSLDIVSNEKFHQETIQGR